MWVLFEKTDSRFGDYISNYDAMGIATNEADAMCWVSQNPEYRCFKFCPKWEVSF